MRVLKLVEILYFYDEVQVFLGKCQDNLDYICVLVEEDTYLVLKNNKEDTSNFIQGKKDLLSLYQKSASFHQAFMTKNDLFCCFKTNREDINPEWVPELGFTLGQRKVLI